LVVTEDTVQLDGSSYPDGLCLEGTEHIYIYIYIYIQEDVLENNNRK
jgi:hypothetical protein